MEPWFDMFVDVMPLAEARTELWWQHRGAWWHEMMWSFGAMPSDVYGCDRRDRPPAWIQCTYHRYCKIVMLFVALSVSLIQKASLFQALLLCIVRRRERRPVSQQPLRG